MGLKRIVSDDIKIIYLNLADSLGFYRARPGKPGYICLSSRLLEGGQPEHLIVYRALLDLHRSLPADSIYRLFPIRKYFEELLSSQPVDLTPAQPEIILIGRASRQWRVSFFERETIRLIG